ncbi:MAG: hypothetical protein V5A55_01295 [Halovenus sp.]
MGVRSPDGLGRAALDFATRVSDLVSVCHAVTDRSSVSRAITPPTFHGIEAGCDVAVVHLAEEPDGHDVRATRRQSAPSRGHTATRPRPQ